MLGFREVQGLGLLGFRVVRVQGFYVWGLGFRV